MKFKIEHREELVGYFEVEADDESSAMDAYQHLVQEGTIDYGDMEMVNSSDELVRSEFEVGQECYFIGCADKPADHFIITEIYDGIGAQKLFDAIHPDGRTLNRIYLRPERIWRTGKAFPITEILSDIWSASIETT